MARGRLRKLHFLLLYLQLNDPDRSFVPSRVRVYVGAGPEETRAAGGLFKPDSGLSGAGGQA
jgi:hypothetical protein